MNTLKPPILSTPLMNEEPCKKDNSRSDIWSNLLQQIALYEAEEAFERIFSHFAPLLKGFFMTSSPALPDDQAEELVQEVMSKVWLKSGKFNPAKSGASTWIYTIARNSRIDYLRKHGRHNIQSADISADDIWDEDSDNQPYISLNQAREKSDIRSLLTSLPEEQQECLTKMYMENKSHSQLADELGLPLGTVKSRIRLGLKRLQAQMATQER